MAASGSVTYPPEDESLVVKIGEARQKLPQMVISLESGSPAKYVVGRYGHPAVALVSYSRFKPMLEPAPKKERLALLIVEQLLADAPQHLRTPAIAELSKLPVDDLMKLWRMDELPMDDKTAARQSKKFKHPAVFERLRQRARIAAAISDARAAGLYEAAEDATSQLDLSEASA